MRNFTIDRSKWRAGSEGDNRLGVGRNFLKNEEGFMCCLGQMINQKYPEVNMLNVSDPHDIEDFVSEDNIFTKCLYISYEENHIVNSDLSSKAIKINDDIDITTEEREKRLKELFKEEKIELNFIN